MWNVFAYNYFYGETMTGREHIHGISLDYRYKSMSSGLTRFNPFVNNYWQDSENRSKYVSYKRSSYTNVESTSVNLFGEDWVNRSVGIIFASPK
jgi:hypothetical protein